MILGRSSFGALCLFEGVTGARAVGADVCTLLCISSSIAAADVSTSSVMYSQSGRGHEIAGIVFHGVGH